jgi:hypothetical protein
MYGYYAKAVTVSTASTISIPTIAGVVTTTAQNAFWDFM